MPPITWTILCFLLLVSLALTPRRYQSEVNLMFLTLRLVLTSVLAIVGFRYYWRYWHQRESGSGSRRSFLYRCANGCLIKNTNQKCRAHIPQLRNPSRTC